MMRLFHVTKNKKNTPSCWRRAYLRWRVRNVVLLQDIKTRAQVIDTTNLSPRKLREEIMQASQQVRKESSRFKSCHLDLNAGFQCGCRDGCVFLPNPHYIPELRPLTGLDEPVYDCSEST